MLNLNYNINKAIGGGGCIGVMKYNYSASIIVAAGGAGGSTGDGNGVGGGGGGGMAVTQSISIIPNVTYQINVGVGGAVNQDAIGNSFLIGFDDNDTIPISFLCEGGKTGTNSGGGIVNGGDSGTGSLVRGGVVTQYTKFNGGTGSYSTSGGFGPAIAGGGGASNQANGANGTTASTQARGGTGASGVTAGGGGGATAGGPTPPPDSQNGQPGLASSGAGIGGNGSGVNPSRGASAGTDGTVIITYAGQPKAFVTNATTTNDGYGNTIHTFNSGSGTFIYTFPYPYEEPATPYQVEECPDKPTGAVFSVRNDPYSASIVVAIPGNLFFTGDYQNQFGMTTPFDDISAYVKGGGNPIGNNLTTATITTGSFVATPTGSLIKWAEQHYDTSLYFSGSASLSVTNTWSANEGANLTFTKDFTIETWAAWPVTASISGSAPLWTPNRYLAYKYDPAITATSQYIFEPWGGDANNPGTARIISGSSRFVYDTSAGEFYATSSFNNSINVNEFNHYAVSYTVDGRGIRLYINGALQGLYTVPAGDMNQDTTELLQMFGAVDTSVPAEQDVTSGTAGYFTDFRMYNGSNKNYTASLIPLPESMVVWN